MNVGSISKGFAMDFAVPPPLTYPASQAYWDALQALVRDSSDLANSCSGWVRQSGYTSVSLDNQIVNARSAADYARQMNGLAQQATTTAEIARLGQQVQVAASQCKESADFIIRNVTINRETQMTAANAALAAAAARANTLMYLKGGCATIIAAELAVVAWCVYDIAASNATIVQFEKESRETSRQILSVRLAENIRSDQDEINRQNALIDAENKRYQAEIANTGTTGIQGYFLYMSSYLVNYGGGPATTGFAY